MLTKNKVAQHSLICQMARGSHKALLAGYFMNECLVYQQS